MRWWPMDGDLRPAFRVRVRRNRPREDWIVYVDAKDESVLSSYDNITLARGRADVFDPNPVAALRDHRKLLEANGDVVEPPERAYVRRTLGSLDNDPDPGGNHYLDGTRVTTRLTRAPRARDADREFLYWSDERGFEEAMVYYPRFDDSVRPPRSPLFLERPSPSYQEAQWCRVPLCWRIP